MFGGEVGVGSILCRLKHAKETTVFWCRPMRLIGGAGVNEMSDVQSEVRDKPKRPQLPLTVIGWMERVDLLDLDLIGLKAKIDTGARTSALHAVDIDHFERDGAPWVSFTTADRNGGSCRAEALVHSDRWIKNTSGVPEERIVVRSRFRLGEQSWVIDLSLADRTNMTFPMIVGRSALKNHSIAVHTHRAYLLSSK